MDVGRCASRHERRNDNMWCREVPKESLPPFLYSVIVFINVYNRHLIHSVTIPTLLACNTAGTQSNSIWLVPQCPADFGQRWCVELGPTLPPAACRHALLQLVILGPGPWVRYHDSVPAKPRIQMSCRLQRAARGGPPTDGSNGAQSNTSTEYCLHSKFISFVELMRSTVKLVSAALVAFTIVGSMPVGTQRAILSGGLRVCADTAVQCRNSKSRLRVATRVIRLIYSSSHNLCGPVTTTTAPKSLTCNTGEISRGNFFLATLKY